MERRSSWDKALPILGSNGTVSYEAVPIRTDFLETRTYDVRYQTDQRVS